MPVTLELAQASAWASSRIGTGASGSSAFSAPSCAGARSNSDAIARNRVRCEVKSSAMRDHASLAAVPLSVCMPQMVLASEDGCQPQPCTLPHMDGIVVDGLVRVFKGGIRAVDGIDLQVSPGEIYGFLGPNGAGKSTTVLMLTTLLPPTAGTARVGGYDVVKAGPRVRGVIGAALQEAALDPFLTGREHMRLQGALESLGWSETTR